MQIFAKDFAKEWVEYPLNPIALASTSIAKESLFCNAITNAQCERNLRAVHSDRKRFLGDAGLGRVGLCHALSLVILHLRRSNW